MATRTKRTAGVVETGEGELDPGKVLRVVALQPYDVLGLREYAITPGRVTLIQGPNGSGKTSLMTAAQAVLGGGSLERIAHVDPGGAEAEPRILAALESADGTEFYRVEKSTKDLRVRKRVDDTQAFEDVRQPQTFLNATVDTVGSNPVTFLQAKDTARADLLLAALPLKMDRGLLELALSDVPASSRPKMPAGLHPLEEIDLITAAVFSTRTGVNRDQEGKAKSAEQLRRTLPAKMPADPAGELRKATAAVEQLAAELGAAEEAARRAEAEARRVARDQADQATAAIQAENSAAIRASKADHEAWAASERRQLEERIAARLAELETEFDAVRAGNELRLDQVETAAAAAEVAARDARELADGANRELAERLRAARERVAVLRAQVEEVGRVQALDEQARTFEQQAADLKADSERLTGALERLKDLRRRLAEDLPIEGLSIAEKVIRVNGVPFDQLNTAQKVAIAVKVAVLRAQERRLPIVWVDNAEALDSEHFAALVDELAQSGVQAFVARVSDEPLSVQVVA